MDKSLFGTALSSAGYAAFNSVRDYAKSYMNRRKAFTARKGKRKVRSTGFPYVQSVRKPRTRSVPKLRRAASKPRRTRKRRNETSTNPADLSAIYKSGGKRLKLSKLVRANKEYGIYQYASITPFGGDIGAYFLRNWTSAGTGTMLQCPLHLYDVSSCVQVNAGTNVRNSALPVHFLRFTTATDTGSVDWENLGNTWTTIAAPNLMAGQSTSGDWLPGGRDILEYVNADLLFYAPTSTATRITVQLVQITEDELHPTNIPTVRNTAFWQSQVKRYVRNPLETMDSRWSKYVKVLKKVAFYMDPKETTETVNARVKRVRLFHRFNRVCNYNWVHNDKVNLLAQDEQLNLGMQLQNRVTPRARIYLMIAGQARNSTVGDDKALHPSYDINLKVKHSALSSST